MTTAQRHFCLIIDDEEIVRVALQTAFESRGQRTATVPSAAEARTWIATHGAPQLFILDLGLGHGESGQELLAFLKASHPKIPVLIITGDARADTCARMMREGAYYYFAKPYRLAQVFAIADEATRDVVPAAAGDTQYSDETRRTLYAFVKPDEFQKLAQTSAALLLQGESGCGAEGLARWLHAAGPHAAGPFVALNCGSMPETLLDDELFGHVAGAFAGALNARNGAFVEAEGGTLFLEALEELPGAVQTRLLKALEDSEIRQLGADRPRRVNVRLIAASGTKLDKAVAQGRFKPDLYYRLTALTLELPPLRQRREHIEAITKELLRSLARAKNRAPVPELSMPVLELLLRHPLPGNLTELRSALDYALSFCSGGTLLPVHFPKTFLEEVSRRRRGALQANEDETRERLVALLKKYSGSNRRVAEELKVDPATVWRMKKRYGLLDNRA